MASVSDNTAETNGTLPTPSWSEEEYKKICKQVKAFQTKKSGGRRKAKPVLKPRGRVIQKEITISIEESPSDWDDITDEPFSLDMSASRIYTKIGKERAKCVNTGKSIPVGGAAVYRVFI
jgi:hypothetical protein